MKKFMTMTLAAMAFVVSMSSCSSSSNDDQSEVPLATQVVGSYTGTEIVLVNAEESSNETKTYQFTKVTDVSVDMVIPEVGMGMMTIPSIPVKNIPLTKNGNSITGKLDMYPPLGQDITVKNAQGEEKKFNIKDLTFILSDKTIAVTFSLKYGNMPMWMDFQFTGSKK